MREINNNVEIGKVQKPELKPSNLEKPELAEKEEIHKEEKKIADFSNPTEIIGRSQVQTPKVDNMKEDIAMISTNPQAVEASEKLYEIVYAKLQKDGHPNAAEEAAAISTEYVQEFYK